MNKNSTMSSAEKKDRLNERVIRLLSESAEAAKDEEELLETIAVLELILASVKAQAEKTEHKRHALGRRINGYLQAEEARLYQM